MSNVTAQITRLDPQTVNQPEWATDREDWDFNRPDDAYTEFVAPAGKLDVLNRDNYRPGEQLFLTTRAFTLTQGSIDPMQPVIEVSLRDPYDVLFILTMADARALAAALRTAVDQADPEGR